MSVVIGRIDMESRGFEGGVCDNEVRGLGGAQDPNQALRVVNDGVVCEAVAGESGIEVLEGGNLGGMREGKVSIVERDDLNDLLQKSKEGVSDSIVKRSTIDDARVKADEESEISGNGVRVNVKDEFRGISLTIELHPFGNEENTSKCTDRTEHKFHQDAIKPKSKARVFGVSDLVWGKVRSHPWWPGQVFDASAASDEAKRHYKKDGVLIAYFGDQTFAWNKVGTIKPFNENLSRMEKQSNSEDFLFAVDCALDEISRRVECELACSCVSEEVYKKLRTQKIVNGGIKKESSEREGGDCSWKATLFDPRKFVADLKNIAVSPLVQFDRLKSVTKKACLCAFYRWKGYNSLPFNMIEGLYENVSFPNVKEHPCELIEVLVHTGIDPEMSNTVKKGKRKGKSGFSLDSKKTKKSLSNESEAEDMHTPLSSLLGMKRKDRDIASDDSTRSSKPQTNLQTKQGYGVGDKIMKVLSKIGKSKPREKIDLSHRNVELMIQQSSPDKLLPVLRLMAQYSGISHDMCSIIIFFSKFRDSVCLEKQQGISLEQLLDSPRDPEDVHETVNSNATDSDSTVLILKFTNTDSIPAEETLNKIFGRFVSLKESETQVLKKSNKAKVVFKKQSDAEAAFSSAGKYSVFGPSLVSYRLNYAASSEPSLAKKRTI